MSIWGWGIRVVPNSLVYWNMHSGVVRCMSGSSSPDRTDAQNFSADQTSEVARAICGERGECWVTISPRVPWQNGRMPMEICNVQGENRGQVSNCLKSIRIVGLQSQKFGNHLPIPTCGILAGICITLETRNGPRAWDVGTFGTLRRWVVGTLG